MNILHRRPLFLCCAVFMLSAVVGFALPTAGKWIGGCLLFVAAAAAVALGVHRRDVRRALLAVIASMLAVLALFQSHVTFHGTTAARLHELEQTTVRVEGVITERRGSGGYMTSYAMSLASVNGEATDGLALLTCHYVSDLQPGYAVELEAILLPLEEAAGDGYDATALRGDGYLIGLLSETEETVVITHESSPILSVRAGKLRRSLAARLNLVTGEEARGIPSALLLGDKSMLADEVRRDFARAGVSHLLAISGLHMTLLFGIFAFLLRIIRIPKRVRAVILGICALGYLFLLGFPPSATRAIIMLGVTYLSHLLSERTDPLTSLGLAGAVILICTPYAVADAGFWMSFLATLGLISLMPLMDSWLSHSAKENKPLWWQVIRSDVIKLTAALLVGLVAMSFTLTVVAAVIGEMSVLSPLATLLLTPFCAAILLLSLLCLPLLGTGAGETLGLIVGDMSRLMGDLTAWMASPSRVVISLRHPAVIPLTAVMLGAVLLLLCMRLPTRRRWLVVLPLLIGWGTLGGVLGIHHLATADEVRVTYLQPSTASDALVLVSEGQGFVCDLSNGSLSSMTAAAREAKQQGATELSVFMLTHYHSRTSGALVSLLARETVRALWMPTPADEEDYYLLLSCVEKAEAAGVPVYLYHPGEALRVFGDGTLTLETTFIKRSVQPVLLLSLDVSSAETGKDRLVYCGSAVFESDLANLASEWVPSADTVVFGSHGPVFKLPYGEGLDLSHANELVFSAYADTAAWFDPTNLPANTPLWVGQKRLVLYKSAAN